MVVAVRCQLSSDKNGKTANKDSVTVTRTARKNKNVVTVTRMANGNSNKNDE